MLSPSQIITDRLLAQDACYKHPWVPLVSKAVVNSTDRSSFLLFAALCLLAYPRSGTVLVDRAGLAEVLGWDLATLDRKVSELEQRDLIKIKTQGFYLALSIRSWPDKRPFQSTDNSTKSPNHEQNAEFSVGSREVSCRSASAESADYKNQNRSAESESKENLEAEQSLGDREGSLRGEEEGWLESFLDRLIQTVGNPEERPSYRSFCRKHPRQIIEAALDRVRHTPKSKIKKSRGALFTYLVKTFGSNPRSHE